MKLEFTKNAQARMLDRGIRQDEVQAALDAPDQLGPCFEKRWHAKKCVNGRMLVVVFARDLFQTQILTAYWQEPSA
jgi:hypothetical protein